MITLMFAPARALSSGLISTLIVSFALAFTLSGATIARAQAPDLNAVIDGLQRKYSRMRGLEADFVQVYQGANGHLLLKRPGKARWQYNSPERKLFVSDGKNIYFYVEGERQASQTTIKE